MLKRAITILASGVFVLWVVGQVFRDTTWYTGLLFYLPTPFVFFLLLTLSGYLLARRDLGKGLVFLVMAAVCGFFLFAVENQYFQTRAPVSSPRFARLVHWNVFQGRLGWKNIESSIRNDGADIYILNEVTDGLGKAMRGDGFWKDYQFRRSGRLAIVARGTIKKGRLLEPKRNLNVYSFIWAFDGRELKFFIVHLASDPLVFRNPLLARLRELMKEHRPDIVVGDFNAPRRSLAISPLPDGYRHAYETRGKGWSYTWPVPVPVYAIDQSILSESVMPLTYALVSTKFSDHRKQVIDLALQR